MSFVESGMTGDDTNAPQDTFRGPYLWSGHVRLGMHSVPYNVGGDYMIPTFSNDVLPSTADCGDRAIGGRRLGACAWWTSACDTWFQQQYGYAKARTKALSDAVTWGPKTKNWSSPCTIREFFVAAMGQINRAVGSLDIYTGKNYPERGYPGFVDRRESTIFGGGPSRSGIKGFCDGQTDSRFVSASPATRLQSLDLSYPDVSGNDDGCTLPGTGGGSMVYRNVYVARGVSGAGGGMGGPPADPNVAFVNPKDLIRRVGTAEFCRHRVPAKYSGGNWGDPIALPFNWPYGDRVAYPLEYWDKQFADLRTQCLEAMAEYLKKNPAVAKLGGVDAACKAGVAAVKEEEAAVTQEKFTPQKAPPSKPGTGNGKGNGDGKKDDGGINLGLIALGGAALVFLIRGRKK